MSTKNGSKSSSKKSSKQSTPSANASAAPVITPAATPTPMTSAEVAQCQALLTQLDGVLGPVTELSADDIRRSLKLRKGGAQVVPQLVDLAKKHGVTTVGPVTPDGLSAQKARADTLNTIGVSFAAVAKKLSDATFGTESDTWQQATSLYTVLQRLAVFNPTLAEGLQPVQAFFQTKKTKGKKRVAEDNRNLVKAEKPVSHHEPTPAESAAPPAANATNVPAPVAVTPAATNGAAHS